MFSTRAVARAFKLAAVFAAFFTSTRASGPIRRASSASTKRRSSSRKRVADEDGVGVDGDGVDDDGVRTAGDAVGRTIGPGVASPGGPGAVVGRGVGGVGVIGAPSGGLEPEVETNGGGVRGVSLRAGDGVITVSNAVALGSSGSGISPFCRR